MDTVRIFHRQRIGAFLRGREGVSATNRNNRASGSPGRATLLKKGGEGLLSVTIGRKNQPLILTPTSALTAEQVLSIPELTLLLLNLSPPWSWPTMCLISKSCAHVIQPRIWKVVVCNTPTTFARIQPYFRKQAHLVQILDLASMPQPWISDLLLELSYLQALPNIITLTLRNSKVTTVELSSLLEKLLQLREIDIRDCTLDKHPLEILSPCRKIESMAFTQDEIPLSSEHGPESIFNSWPQLRRLNISRWADHDTIIPTLQLEEVIRTSRLDLESLELTLLCLSDCRFSGPVLAHMAASLVFLQSITVRHCALVTTQDLLMVAQSCPSIRHVDLAGFTINDEMFGLFARAASTLVSLVLTDCIFSSAGLKQVPEHCVGLMSSHTTQEVKASEGQVSSGTAALAAGAKILQSFKPLSGICESLCGMHLFPNDPKRQTIAYHYCHMIDEDRRQCLLYDSNSENAKLVGVEYVISEKLFKSLDEDEKKYWHSHKYEVESGLLVLVAKAMVPESVAQAAEMTPFQILVNTYGKTIQLWPVDEKGECSSHIPTGPPRLLMSFTRDEQVNIGLLHKRDQDMGISTAQKRKEREGKIQGNPVADGADQWEKGKPWQIYDEGPRGSVSMKM
ncbi:hypothetical protein BGZ65_004517 [Modicella reniformis]|uniref:F-box domain-containing protein n=1 Tax=Modicella reniformis TaxID=1440133 RepID=A0A9P6MBI1_9FUNG|nr:hypothetical protein BGZ65_004517 [Modicella reniformis]